MLAAIAVAALVIWALYRRHESRTPHLQAFADGEVPLEALPGSMQKRLTSEGHRHALAGTMRKMSQDAAKIPKRRTLPNPPVTYHFREGVRHEMTRVGELLERPETPPRAVAVAELLLADGTSAFYGEDETAMLAALRSVRDAAQTTDA